MKAERRYTGGRSYVLLGDDGKFVCSLTTRDVLALIAARDGRAHLRERRVHSYCFTDIYLVPECEVYGVAFGTLQGLQSAWTHPAHITTPAEPGPLALTEFGEQCLAAVLALPGVNPERFAA